MSRADEVFVTPTHRDLMRQICPPWLQTGNNEKFLYAVGLAVDTFGDALLAALKLRFPAYYSPDSLAVIGRERLIARGLTEPDEIYATRLIRWLDDHSTRGGPYAMLAQLHAYYAPHNFTADLVYRNGRYFHVDTNGVVTRGDLPTFSPDDRPEQWARWWLFAYTDELVDPTPEQIAEIRLIPAQWNAAHCQGTIVVLSGDQGAGTGAELWNFPIGHVWNEPGNWNTPPAIFITV